MFLNLKPKKINLNEEIGSVWVIFSVVLAGLFITAALIMTSGDRPSTRAVGNIASSRPGVNNDIDPDPSQMPPVTEDDYMIGDINAPIQIVEYSDMECPFCSRIHDTLHELVEMYPQEIVWIYRHLPIVNVHPKALTQAIAVECAGEQKGNEGYWAMLDSIYKNTPGGNRFDLSNLQIFAAAQNLNIDEFNECLGSGRYENKIAQQVVDGFASGAQGTPYSIVITPSGERIPVPGAQPLEYWVSLINQIMDQEINSAEPELIEIEL